MATLKGIEVDYTADYSNQSGSTYHVGHLSQDGNTGKQQSPLQTKTFEFDNRSGSSTQAKTWALMLTHVVTNAGGFANCHQWGSFKNNNYSWETYYYKYVTFNSNGGTGTMSQQTVENSGTLTANAFTREDYIFAGWNTEADGTGTNYVNGATITATESSKGPVTLYALWTPKSDIPWDGSGTQEDPYQIKTTDDLDQLATKVEGGATYVGTHFKLMNDIAYTHTTAWNDAESTENNYTAIAPGRSSFIFCGTFDGAGHTISGIRIYKSYDGVLNERQGIFGQVGTDANIHSLRLADARITGYDDTGGIAGFNNGTVTDCHVANDVCINAVLNNAFSHGGIAGENYNGTIENCTSAATLTVPSAPSGRNYGGIAGRNYSNGTLRNNLAIGATVPAGNFNCYGAITGENFGTLQCNYYTACTVAGEPNATGVGCGGTYVAGDYVSADFTPNDGAVSALRDQYDNTTTISLFAALAQTDDDRPVLPLDLGWGAGQFPMQIAGRTLYKDGDWNTLTLPFALASLTGTPLEGATVMELDTEDEYSGHKTGYDSSDGTLSLYFKDATAIEAGKPYLVKWASGDNIVSPVFNAVTVSNVHNDVTSVDERVQFRGNYSPVVLPGNDASNLYLGTNNKLYWPSADKSIKSFRAYFHVALSGNQPARNIVMNLGEDDPTIVFESEERRVKSEESDDVIYNLSGQKVDASYKGIVIKNGKKVIQ